MIRGRARFLMAGLLATCSCAPIIEAGTGAVFVVDPDPAKRASGGAGWRGSLAAGGANPRGGPFGRLEADATRDTGRGTTWSWRLHLGYTVGAPIQEPGLGSLELGADAGSRFRDGNAFAGTELGLRTGWVIPIVDSDRLPEQNQAFIFIGRSIDVVVNLRGGVAWPGDDDFVIDASAGFAVRVRAWTDVL